MPDCLPVRDLLTHIIGGGWGSDSADDVNEQEVAIIRGADFPQVQVGDVTSLPFRFESSKRVGTRRLQEGDIVFEISGGTNERPTGRSVFVCNSLLAQVPVPVIPASFCRLLRPNPLMVEPRYLYFWLQDMFEQGRTWAYQVRSTGIANFQTEYFLDHELVTLPPLNEQRRIAGVLGALDNLIEVNRGLIRNLRELALARYAELSVLAKETRRLGDLVTVNGSQVKTAAVGNLTYLDISSVGDGIVEWPPHISWANAPSRARRLAPAGSIIWSTVRPNRRAHALLTHVPDDLVVSTGFAVLEPKVIGSAEIFCATNGDDFVDYLMSRAGGSAYPAVRGSVFEDAVMPHLGAETSAKFESFAWPLLFAAGELAEESRQLATTRDELLPLLMSGRVRVREDGVAA